MTHTASLPTFVSLNMIDMVIDWWAHQFHVNLERFACTQDRVRIQSHTTHNIGKRKLWSLIGLQNVHKIAQAVKLKCDNGARPEAAVPVVRTQLQLFFFFIYLFAHSRITHKVMCLLHSNDNNNHVNNNMETSSIQVCTPRRCHRTQWCAHIHVDVAPYAHDRIWIVRFHIGALSTDAHFALDVIFNIVRAFIRKPPTMMNDDDEPRISARRINITTHDCYCQPSRSLLFVHYWMWKMWFL